VVTLGVLGPLQVDGTPAPLSHRDRVVLAALAVTPGGVVAAESLADALWGASLPPSAAKVVQGAILRIRRLLGRSAVESVPGGYRLTVVGDDLDSSRFDRLAERGRALAAVGEPSRAVVALEQALGLWRGPAFDELDGWLPGREEARRLDEQRLVLEEEWLEVGLGCGRAHELIGPAQRLATQCPHRERRWQLLATALYGAGRQAEALEVLRRAGTALREEHGLDPSPAMADLERAVLHQDPSLPVGSRGVPGGTGGCPYPGMAAFDVEDADMFFGREAEKATCMGRLAAHPVLVVVGPSGSGKSSLVRAGVVPALARSGRRMVVVTPGADPLATLDVALGSSPVGAGLVVDQLEELFIRDHDHDLIERFLDRVAGRAIHGPVVITVRADHLGGLAASSELTHLADRGIHLLTPMAEPDIRRAIQEPARHAGLLLEPGLVDLLLRDVLGEPAALPHLSHALAETWDRREGDVLTVEGYLASGGIRGAVAQSAELLFESLDPAGRETLRSLLLRLVTPSLTGDPVSTRVPARILRASDGGSEVLDQLVRARLVTTDEDTVAIAHESLALAWPRLRSWLDDDVDGRRSLGHLQVAADGWASTRRPEEELYRGGRLQTALEWKERSHPFLSRDEEDFLDASVLGESAQERHARDQLRGQIQQNRRLRRLLTAVATFLVLALVAGGVAIVSGQRLQASERDARDAGIAARDAEAQARAARVGTAALLEPRADTSLLVARQAVALADTSQTSVDLLRALDAEQGLLSIRDLKLGSNIGAQTVMSPDHRRLMSWQEDGIHLVDTATGEELPAGHLLASGQLQAALFPAGFTDAGRTVVISRPAGVAAGGPAREIVRFSAETGQQVGAPETVSGATSDDFWTVDRIRISPDGQHLLSMSGASVRVWNR
jgi:DNA-binding SARP family transcriptional activator